MVTQMPGTSWYHEHQDTLEFRTYPSNMVQQVPSPNDFRETPSCANGAGVGLRKVSPHEAAQQRSLSHIRIADEQDFEEDVVVTVSHDSWLDGVSILEAITWWGAIAKYIPHKSPNIFHYVVMESHCLSPTFTSLGECRCC